MNSKEMYEAHNVVENSQFDECCNCGEHSPIMHESEKWNGDICFACYEKEEPFRKEMQVVKKMAYNNEEMYKATTLNKNEKELLLESQDKEFWHKIHNFVQKENGVICGGLMKEQLEKTGTWEILWYITRAGFHGVPMTDEFIDNL